MDTPEKPKRPWWKKKRIWAGAILLLAAAWPATIGPVIYAAQVGWLPKTAFRWHEPTTRLIYSTPLAKPYARYVAWWMNLRPSSGHYTVTLREDGSFFWYWHAGSD